MSAKPSDPIGRLPALEAARAGIKKKTILNLAEMAKVAGVTARGFKLYLDTHPGCPVEQRGDMGAPWQFDARKTLGYLINSAKAARKSLEARRAEVDRLAGLGAAAGSPPAGEANGSGSAADHGAMTVTDLGKLVQVNREFQRAKIEQGSLVSAVEAEQAAIDYNNVVQSAILDSAQRADPAGIWAPEMRNAWEEATRNMLVAIQDEANRWIGRIRSHRNEGKNA